MVLQRVPNQFSEQQTHYENNNVTCGANVMDWSSFPFGGVSNYSYDSGHNGERLLSILVTMKY